MSMETALLITESLKYIELHLKDPLTTAEISRAIGYSEFYFSRRFKKEMKMTVMEYVKGRKLLKASEEILDGEKIIDVALRYGWETHSGFTKSFKQEFGFCPALLKAMTIQIGDLEEESMKERFLRETEIHSTKEELFQRLVEEIKLAKIKIDYDELKAVYSCACRSYKGKMRYSGDEYITHPLNVAILLAEMGTDKDIIYAGMFCDVLEKTSMTIGQLKRELPAGTISVLENAARIENVWEDDSVEEVIILKLAERLHNMRTAQFVTEQQRKQKARETIGQILPVAKKMGNARLTAELQELSVKYLCEGDIRTTE